MCVCVCVWRGEVVCVRACVHGCMRECVCMCMCVEGERLCVCVCMRACTHVGVWRGEVDGRMLPYHKGRISKGHLRTRLLYTG